MGPQIKIVLLGVLGAVVVFVVSLLFSAFRDRQLISSKVMKVDQSRERPPEPRRLKPAYGWVPIPMSAPAAFRSNLVPVLALLALFFVLAALLKETDIAKSVTKWVVDMMPF